MHNDYALTIPAAFLHPLFFSNKETITFNPSISVEEAICNYFFLHDIVNYEKMVLMVKPWEHPNKYVPVIFDNWKRLKEILSPHFKSRDKNRVKEPMIHAIASWISALFWTNGTSLTSLTDVNALMKNLVIKPVNAEERLEFIMNGPGHYNSFIQLSELYFELEKLFYISLIKKQSLRD
jgi:hypothetical protein